MTSRSMAGRSTISGVVAGWQPPTPSLSSPKKAAPGTLLLPQGGRTQWGKATIREFPHSLLPWRGRATLGEKESLVPPSGPPTRPGRGVPWGNSACGQTRESRSDPGGPLGDRDPHISQELSVALCLLPGPCPAVSRLGTTSQSHLHRSPSASPELTQPVHSAPPNLFSNLDDRLSAPVPLDLPRRPPNLCPDLALGPLSPVCHPNPRPQPPSSPGSIPPIPSSPHETQPRRPPSRMSSLSSLLPARFSGPRPRTARREPSHFPSRSPPPEPRRLQPAGGPGPARPSRPGSPPPSSAPSPPAAPRPPAAR